MLYIHYTHGSIHVPPVRLQVLKTGEGIRNVYVYIKCFLSLYELQVFLKYKGKVPYMQHTAYRNVSTLLRITYSLLYFTGKILLKLTEESPLCSKASPVHYNCLTVQKVINVRTLHRDNVRLRFYIG